MGNSHSVFTAAHGQMPGTYLVTSRTDYELGALAILDQESGSLEHLGLHANEFFPGLAHEDEKQKKPFGHDLSVPENKIKLSSEFQVSLGGETKLETTLNTQVKVGTNVGFKALKKDAFTFVGDKVLEKPCHDKVGVADKLSALYEGNPQAILSQERRKKLEKKKLTLVVVVEVVECASGMVLWSREEGLSLVGSVDATVATPTPLSQVILSGKLNFDRQKKTVFEDTFSARDRPYTCFVKVARIAGLPIKGAFFAPGDPVAGMAVKSTLPAGLAKLDA